MNGNDYVCIITVYGRVTNILYHRPLAKCNRKKTRFMEDYLDCSLSLEFGVRTVMSYLVAV